MNRDIGLAMPIESAEESLYFHQFEPLSMKDVMYVHHIL